MHFTSNDDPDASSNHELDLQLVGLLPKPEKHGHVFDRILGSDGLNDELVALQIFAHTHSKPA